MKAHVGVDSRTKLIHTVLVSAANVHDCDAPPYLLHGRETRVWGDQGYQGQSDLIHEHAPHAKDFTNKHYRFNGWINEIEKTKNRNKSRARVKVEHVFGVIKHIFGFRKARYRGLAKNLHRLEVTAALTNLHMVRAESCSRRRRRVYGNREMTEFEAKDFRSAAGNLAFSCLSSNSASAIIFMTSFSDVLIWFP